VESASDLDPQLADAVIAADSFADVPAEALRSALRRIAGDPASGGLVTCLGSSYRNVGVQPLMDAVVDYGPSPEDRHYPFLRYYQVLLLQFCALYFMELFLSDFFFRRL
jgi:elongation factor G